jgi:hypothetical protein
MECYVVLRYVALDYVTFCYVIGRIRPYLCLYLLLCSSPLLYLLLFPSLGKTLYNTHHATQANATQLTSNELESDHVT